MKKIIALLLSISLFVTLAACGTDDTSSDATVSKVFPNGTTASVPDDGNAAANEIPVEVVGTVTGSGSVVQQVTVDKSGATLISISKKEESKDNTSSGSSSSTDTTNKDPLMDLGLDFVLKFDSDDITILQLTDFRIIDSTQQRTMGLFGQAQADLYKPENMQELLFDYIKKTIDEAKPDLILVSGNLVQGEFDDLGKSFKAVINYLESFKIFWAPVFGDLDNISAQGVEWQAKQFENAKYCLFNRNNAIGGNSNYTIGIGINNVLSRVIYMMDSNGCSNSTDPAVTAVKGLTEKQIEWMKTTAATIKEKNGKAVPAFTCFGCPSADVTATLVGAGYQAAGNEAAAYKIGTDVTAKNGDSGTKGGLIDGEHTIGTLAETFKEIGIDGVFMGDNPASDFSVLYGGIRWTLGRKTGKYDTTSDLNGGTKIKLSNGGKAFAVTLIG